MPSRLVPFGCLGMRLPEAKTEFGTGMLAVYGGIFLLSDGIDNTGDMA